MERADACLVYELRARGVIWYCIRQPALRLVSHTGLEMHTHRKLDMRGGLTTFVVGVQNVIYQDGGKRLLSHHFVVAILAVTAFSLGVQPFFDGEWLLTVFATRIFQLTEACRTLTLVYQ